MVGMKWVALVADRLAALYPEETSVRRVLGQAQVDVTRIPFDGRASNVAWFASVEAARQGRLDLLVEVMGEEYPLDEWVAWMVNAMAEGAYDGGHDDSSDQPRGAGVVGGFT